MRCRADRGFTLVELLLGLGISCVVMACVYGTFWAGVKLSHRFERGNSDHRQIRLAFDLISRELENMLPYDFSNSYPDRRAFEGGEERIAFLAASPEGLKVVSYHLIPKQTGKIHKVMIGGVFKRNVDMVIQNENGLRAYDLVREETDFVDYLNAAPPQLTEVIAGNVKEKSLKFSFGYLEDVKTQSYLWKNEWHNGDLPLAVRLEMEFLPSEQSDTAVTMERKILIPHGSLGKEES